MNRWKIGIPTNKKNETIEDYINNFNLLKEASFESLDFQSFLHLYNPIYDLNDDDFKNLLFNVKEEASKRNLIINQLHAYWDYPPVRDYTAEGLKSQIKYYIRSFEGARLLETKYVVIHPRFPFGLDEEINNERENEFFEINVEFLKELEPYAKENNVIICLENMPMNNKFCRVDGILEIIKSVNSDFVKMCLDIGHANIFKDDLYQDIISIGRNLCCLHVHDNLHGKDLHMYPYQGDTKWDDVIKGLKEIGFQGVFSFETAPSTKLSRETRLLGYKHLYEIGKDLMKL